MKFMFNGSVMIRLDGNEKIMDLPEENPVHQVLELVTKEKGGFVLDELLTKVFAQLAKDYPPR